MQNQITTTSPESQLTPAPAEKIREAVARVFAAYPAYGSAEATDSAIGTYAAMLKEYPIKAITDAAQAFMSGRVAGYNPANRPSVAQWVVETHSRRDAMRAAMMPPKALPPPEKPRSAEDRAKVAELLAGLAEQITKPNSVKAKPNSVSLEDELAALASQPIRVSEALFNDINKASKANERAA